MLSQLSRRLATLIGLKLVGWGEQSKVVEAGEGVAIVRLYPGEWAIITAKSYHEWRAPKVGDTPKKVSARRISDAN